MRYALVDVQCTHAARTQGKFCMHLSACSQCRSEATLTTNVFLNLVHVFANRQHTLASTAGCDRGSRVLCFSFHVLPTCSEKRHKRDLQNMYEQKRFTAGCDIGFNGIFTEYAPHIQRSLYWVDIAVDWYFFVFSA